jgi:CheY-like chemotaxis protein
VKTILIVEDIDLNIDLLVQLLEEEYSLLVARDGMQAVAMTRQHSPDLILMDISLPVMDGYTAALHIRQFSHAVPIIGLSAHAMGGDSDKALAAGCSDYITKPVDENILMAKLQQYLG